MTWVLDEAQRRLINAAHIRYVDYTATIDRDGEPDPDGTLPSTWQATAWTTEGRGIILDEHADREVLRRRVTHALTHGAPDGIDALDVAEDPPAPMTAPHWPTPTEARPQHMGAVDTVTITDALRRLPGSAYVGVHPMDLATVSDIVAWLDTYAERIGPALRREGGES